MPKFPDLQLSYSLEVYAVLDTIDKNYQDIFSQVKSYAHLYYKHIKAKLVFV